MSVALDPNMQDLASLGAILDRAEASERAEASTRANQPAERVAGTERAGAELKGETQKPISKPTDTPAAGDEAAGDLLKAEATAKSVLDKNSETVKAKVETKSTDENARDPKGRFAKAQERLEKTWEGVNKRKGEQDTQAQALTQRENALKQQQADFDRQREQSQSQYKPEDYEKSATGKLDRAKGLHQQADGIEARAQKLEDDGKYSDAAKARDEAKGVRKAAYKEEGNAEDLNAHAQSLRKNPPATAQARDAAVETQRKEWTMKAATEFPDLGKEDSELQKTVSAHLNQLWKENRALASDPQIIYHVTRLAVAETAAARVPGLAKELEQYQAKVKELEGLTAPGGGGSAQRVTTGAAAKTDAEEGSDLRNEANTIGAIPR